MPGANKNTPAQWIGGQRRKLVRRNRSTAGPPRSSTMPILNPGSAAASLVSSVNSIGSDCVKDRQSEDNIYDLSVGVPLKQPDFDDKKQPHAPGGEVKSGATYSALADGPPAPSPKLTATDSSSKKKPGLFHSKKSKTLDHSSNSGQQLLTSPLPASTPTKAARFFGLDAKCTGSGKGARIAKDHHDGYNYDPQSGAPVRLELKKQFTIPVLTRLKPGNKMQDAVLEAANPTETIIAAATEGLQVHVPKLANSGRSPIEQTTSVHRPVAIPKRRMRKKTPKEFHRMSPITEASSESLRPTYRKGEGDEVSELGVISEYEHNDRSYGTGNFQSPQARNASKLPNTRTGMTLRQQSAFELDEADLSPSDEFYDEAQSDEEEDIHVVHPGTRVGLTRSRPRRHGFYVQSPLQHAENAYLDTAEEQMRLEAWKTTLDRVEAEKQAMDAEIAVLRHEHERLRLNFSAATPRADESVEATSNEDHDYDSVSLRRSIDFNEEATIHEAKVMTFTNSTPGMVKLVDIPRRKKKAVANFSNGTPVLKDSEMEQKEVAAASSTENAIPPLITHYHHEDPDCTAEPKKSKMTRDESRLLVQNWITDYNSTEQRPVSVRVDPDVLADQETPPAPFPKGDEDLPTPPMKPRSDSLKLPKALLKHQCINNGHIFHPIDLKTLPDDACINSLEVRPYLQTYTGVKQHVKIPVLCEKCADDCDEDLWECEIAVCRMVVCQTCAENMEAEWQERAVHGWKYK